MKKKMNLKNLKVKSFVTNIENETSETVKAGGPVSANCPLTIPFSRNIHCVSDLGLISQCCPSEYRTACESGNITCYEEKEKDKFKL